MNLFFDTSALIKKYIDEAGSNNVDVLFEKAETIYISAITAIESISSIKRLLSDKIINKDEYDIIKHEMFTDFNFFTVIDLDDNIKRKAIELIEKYQLKSLDSIQLGTASYLKNEINYLVACDEKLLISGKKEYLKIINPLE